MADEAHSAISDPAPSGESHELHQTIQPDASRESAMLHAAPPAIDVAIRQSHGAMRAYAVVHPGSSLYWERVCTLLQVLEHPVAVAAPVGSYLLRDAVDVDGSVVCAEKVLDGGWVLNAEATP